MAEYPYLPLWTDAYLADTRHLSTEEHGAYLLLLMEAWRRPSCSLPDDDRLLARLAGLSEARWAAIKPTIMALWKHDGRRKEWTQKRLFSEREKTASKKQVAKDKAAKRWNKTKNGDAAAMLGRCAEHAIQNQNHIEERRDFVSPKESADSAQLDLGDAPCAEPPARPQPPKREPPQPNPPQDEADLDAAFADYAALAAELGLADCQKRSAARTAKLRARLRDAGGIEGWRAAMAKARASPLIRGETGRDGWRPCIDFFLQESSFTKLMEGAYDGRRHKPAAGGQPARRSGGTAFDTLGKLRAARSGGMAPGGAVHRPV